MKTPTVRATPMAIGARPFGTRSSVATEMTTNTRMKVTRASMSRPCPDPMSGPGWWRRGWRCHVPGAPKAAQVASAPSSAQRVGRSDMRERSARGIAGGREPEGDGRVDVCAGYMTDGGDHDQQRQPECERGGQRVVAGTGDGARLPCSIAAPDPQLAPGEACPSVDLAGARRAEVWRCRSRRYAYSPRQAARSR
jgi:hypothetical protein